MLHWACAAYHYSVAHYQHSAWSSVTTLPVTLRRSDAEAIVYGTAGGVAAQLGQVTIAPVIQGLMQAAADPVYASRLTLQGLLLPELALFSLASPGVIPSSKSIDSTLRCVDESITSTAVGPISFSVVTRQGNFPFSDSWAPSCDSLAAQVCQYRVSLADAQIREAFMGSAYNIPEGLMEEFRFAQSPQCLAVAKADLLGPHTYSTTHFVVSGDWSRHDPYAVPAGQTQHAVYWAPESRFALPGLDSDLGGSHDRPASLASTSSFESQAILARLDLGAEPGIGHGDIHPLITDQKAGYASAMTALRLPVMLGAAVVHGGIQAITTPSEIASSEHSRLSALATALLANNRPGADGKPQTTSARINQLLSQTVTSRETEFTLLAFYHHNAKNKALQQMAVAKLTNTLGIILTQSIPSALRFTEADEAILAAGKTANPIAHKRVTKKASVVKALCDRLTDIKRSLEAEAPSENKDPLAHNVVVRLFCDKRTPDEIHEEIQAKCLASADKEIKEIDDVSILLNEYTVQLGKRGYECTQAEAEYLCTLLEINHQLGSTVEVRATGKSTGVTVLTTPDGKTALTASLWDQYVEPWLAMLDDAPTLS